MAEEEKPGIPTDDESIKRPDLSHKLPESFNDASGAKADMEEEVGSDKGGGGRIDDGEQIYNRLKYGEAAPEKSYSNKKKAIQAIKFLELKEARQGDGKGSHLSLEDIDLIIKYHPDPGVISRFVDYRKNVISLREKVRQENGNFGLELEQTASPGDLFMALNKFTNGDLSKIPDVSRDVIVSRSAFEPEIARLAISLGLVEFDQLPKYIRREIKTAEESGKQSLYQEMSEEYKNYDPAVSDESVSSAESSPFPEASPRKQRVSSQDDNSVMGLPEIMAAQRVASVISTYQNGFLFMEEKHLDAWPDAGKIYMDIMELQQQGLINENHPELQEIASNLELIVARGKLSRLAFLKTSKGDDLAEWPGFNAREGDSTKAFLSKDDLKVLFDSKGFLSALRIYHESFKNGDIKAVSESEFQVFRDGVVKKLSPPLSKSEAKSAEVSASNFLMFSNDPEVQNSHWVRKPNGDLVREAAREYFKIPGFYNAALATKIDPLDNIITHWVFPPGRLVKPHKNPFGEWGRYQIGLALGLSREEVSKEVYEDGGLVDKNKIVRKKAMTSLKKVVAVSGDDPRLWKVKWNGEENLTIYVPDCLPVKTAPSFLDYLRPKVYIGGELVETSMIDILEGEYDSEDLQWDGVGDAVVNSYCKDFAAVAPLVEAFIVDESKRRKISDSEFLTALRNYCGTDRKKERSILKWAYYLSNGVQKDEKKPRLAKSKLELYKELIDMEEDPLELIDGQQLSLEDLFFSGDLRGDLGFRWYRFTHGGVVKFLKI